MPDIVLKNLWDLAWELLLEAENNGKHPFATPSVGTTGADGHPRLRTLILRKADRQAGQLWCYTDRRSIKVRHLEKGDEEMAWLFWDPENKVQFTAGGPTHWLPESDTRPIYLSLPKHGRKAYATVSPPGSVTREKTDGLPDNWDNLAQGETDYALSNFGVLVTQLRWAEVLQLNREGNQRMRATRSEQNDWGKTWLVP